jgi:hypothetical protein
MEARSQREVKDGSEYDSFFPPPDANDITVKKSADVEDTLSLMQKTVPQTLWQTKKIARKLKGKTLDETCSNIWHFVYDHIKYKKDKEGVEQVRSPRRTWSERHSGVDCDCYTQFISSILLNLDIPHKVRITKYPKRAPEVPRWQHIYPIVPVDGDTDKSMTNRDNYIVIDCVKGEYDSEQPFLESKDYNMRLDYLDGIDQEGEQDVQNELELMGEDFSEPENTDIADLSSIYDSDEEMGNIFKKIGKAVKKVGDKVGQGVRFLNRYTNPATILLRNGFLLAMKTNLMNVGGRLRYAYLTDAQAKAMGINPDTLSKLRKVKDRAETVYWQAGGKKENLKKAILKGKGNKNKKVPVSGLDGLDDVYADADEYNIIHNDVNGLGELGIVAATAVAAATSAVAAIAGALKQVKGLFNKGGKEEQSFQSETDNAGSASDASTIPEDEDALVNQEESSPTQTSQSYAPAPAQSFAPTAKSALPNTTASSLRVAANAETQSQESSQAVPMQNDQAAKMGFVQRTTDWVKANPGKTLLIAGAVAGGTYLLLRPSPSTSRRTFDGLSGKTHHKKRRKHQKRRQSKSKSKHRIQSIKL